MVPDELHRDRDADRPTLSGPEATIASDDGWFVLHYTTEGVDRVAGGDADGDGVPDAVPRVLGALRLGRESFLARGYRPLLHDDGTAGSSAIDVYFHAVDSNGYAYPIDSQEGGGESCFAEVDPGLGDLGAAIESVAIHELHHCVQFAYTSDGANWVYESTATWEQYLALLDPGLELALGILYITRLDSPDLPINNRDGRFEYAGFLLLSFWEQFGGVDRSGGPDLWEALAANPDWKVALPAESERRWGMSFEEVYLEWGVWNAFACALDDGRHYDPAILDCPVAASVPIAEIMGSEVLFSHTDTPYTTSYAETPASGDERPISLSCDPLPAGTEGGIALLAVDADGVCREEVTGLAGEGVALELRLNRALDPEGSVRIVSTSTGAEPLEIGCAITRVDPIEVPQEVPEEPEASACGCRTGGSGISGVLLAMGLLGIRRRR